MKYNLAQSFFIKGGAIEMKAIKKWQNKSYLKEKFNNSIVKVMQFISKKDMEIGRNYEKEIKFNDYMDDLHSGQYLTSPLNKINVHKDIYKDLYNPKFTGPNAETPESIKLWIGKDTKSGAHIHGKSDWVLHQIVGKKIVHLIPFEQLTLNSVFSKRLNFSKENIFEIDKSKYDILTLELEPGDTLYIPPWVWHATENIGYTVAVTKIFKRDKDYSNKFGGKLFTLLLGRLLKKFIKTISKLTNYIILWKKKMKK